MQSFADALFGDTCSGAFLATGPDLSSMPSRGRGPSCLGRPSLANPFPTSSSLEATSLPSSETLLGLPLDALEALPPALLEAQLLTRVDMGDSLERQASRFDLAAGSLSGLAHGGYTPAAQFQTDLLYGNNPLASHPLVEPGRVGSSGTPQINQLGLDSGFFGGQHPLAKSLLSLRREQVLPPPEQPSRGAASRALLLELAEQELAASTSHHSRGHLPWTAAPSRGSPTAAAELEQSLSREMLDAWLRSGDLTLLEYLNLTASLTPKTATEMASPFAGAETGALRNAEGLLRCQLSPELEMSEALSGSLASCLSEPAQGASSAKRALSETDKRLRRLAGNREAARRMRKRQSDRYRVLELEFVHLKRKHGDTLKALEEATARIGELKRDNERLQNAALELRCLAQGSD